ncbi:MAG: PilZ domain-containing protein [Phycisphaerales bacterium]|jgi:hypothetical protein|nr:PilZ domain-containing protein [Phycisphaerales bacterium]
MSHQTPDHSQGDLKFNHHSSSSAAEHRCERRFSCIRKIKIVSTDKSDNHPSKEVELLDCSAHGLGLLTADPMEVGSQFIATLNREGTLLVLYTVRHCRPAEQGRFKIGASFDAFFGSPTMQNPQEILNTLLNEFPGEQKG